MKKIFFAVLAITALSTAFANTGKTKHAKKAAKTTECPKTCPRTMGCAT